MPGFVHITLTFEQAADVYQTMTVYRDRLGARVGELERAGAVGKPEHTAATAMWERAIRATAEISTAIGKS